MADLPSGASRQPHHPHVTPHTEPPKNYGSDLQRIAALGENAVAKAATGEGTVTGDTKDLQVVTRDDRSAMQKIADFLNPQLMGPIFISEPIRGKIYVMEYPRFQEILDAQVIAQNHAAEPSNDEFINQLLISSAEMLVACKGWLPAGDTVGFANLRANIMSPPDWPKLQKVNWHNSRDPGVSTDIGALWQAFEVWRKEVTPTEDELEKYWSTVGLVGSS